jgi:hypothetical protein
VHTGPLAAIPSLLMPLTFTLKYIQPAGHEATGPALQIEVLSQVAPTESMMMLAEAV